MITDSNREQTLTEITTNTASVSQSHLRTTSLYESWIETDVADVVAVQHPCCKAFQAKTVATMWTRAEDTLQPHQCHISLVLNNSTHLQHLHTW